MFDFLKSEEDFDSTNFIVFLYMWRKPLLLISIAAFLAAIIFTSPFFITPKFKSTVIMYPVASNSISKAILGDNIGDRQDVMQFGEEEQTEQMLQILNSNKIKDRIIEEFSLLEHYKIDKHTMYQKTRLYKAFDNNITFRRTEYMAVKITVLDKDPMIASEIANTIADLLDSTKNVMQKQRAIKAFEIVETEYMQQMDHVRKMEDSLTKLRQLGVHDYESQSEMIHQQLAIELARNNHQGIKALQGQLEILAKYGGSYVSIRDQLEYEKKLLSEKKTRLIFAKVDATEILPQKFVVDEAFPAEKKSYPVRWIIVLISTLSAFILGMLVLAMLDSLTRFKKKSLVRKST
jgi:capsular polysaccharide biosynthesis protein